ATSREPLAIPEETVLPVPPLSLPAGSRSGGQAPSVAAALTSEAVQLFVARARARRPDFALTDENAAAVSAICAGLDGLPLAIEMAAARVGLLTPHEIAARLGSRLGLLTGVRRAMLPRHQTLRAAIDWSYDLLSAAEQTLFNRLGIFSGGFDLAAVEAVCRADGAASEPGAPEADLLLVLARLVERSLVVAEAQAGQSRYRLLETLRVYARERLAASGGLDEAGARHAAYYLAVAQAGARASHASQRAALDAAAAELPNLRAALEWFLAHADAEHAIQLAAYLVWYWNVRGMSEGRTWLQRALACPGTAPPAVRAYGLARAGSLARLQGDLAAAETLVREAIALFQECQRSIDLASSLAVLAAVKLEAGDRPGAAALAEEALAALNGAEHDETRSTAYQVLGLVALHGGDPLQARQWWQQAVRHAERSGRRDVVALLAINLGQAAYRLGELEAAEDCYRTASHIAAELDDRRARYYIHFHHGMLCLGRGDLAAAAAHARATIETARLLDYPSGVATGLEALALVAAAAGEAARAAQLFAAVDAWRDRAALLQHPAYQQERAQARAGVRAALGEQRLAALGAAAAVQPLEEAIAEALAWAAAVADARRPAPGPSRAESGALLAVAGLGLTAREREILELATQGENPKAIARQLVLSTRTVERHLANIYAKLGVHSRAEAVARVLRPPAP
ncbi:MAG TPA: LuxR C-terminal-related transcriptional regulator, partial [Dehalococcoidia bacterium]|nr:LuxR C-terminal-related transcriptional regulator [Dehalococcoidia bacterium]